MNTRMKRGSIILIIILLISLSLMPLSLAKTTTKVTDGEFRFIDAFSHQGNTYAIRAVNGHEEDAFKTSILIKKNGEGVFVDYDECEETTNYKYCYVSRSYEGNKVDVDSNGNVQPAITILIEEYTYENELEITRTFEKTSFYLYEIGQVTIVAKNIGDRPLTNIKLVEKIPDNFEFQQYSTTMAYVDNSIFNVFTLYPDNTWTTKYQIKAMEYNTTGYYTEATYSTSTENKLTKSSTEQTLKVITPYTTSQTTFSTSFDRNDDVIYSVTLKNNENEDLKIDYITITAPTVNSMGTGLSMRRDGPLQHKYRDGTIAPGEEVTFTIEDKIPSIGKFQFSHQGRFELKGTIYYLQNISTFDVEIDGMNCYITFNKTEPKAGETIQYNITINNRDDEPFYELNSSVKSKAYNHSFQKNNIFVGEEKTTTQKIVQLPFSLEDEIQNFSLNIKYRTADNKFFNCNSTYGLFVQGIKRIVEANITSNQDTVRVGENASITTNIHNLLEEQEIENVHITHRIINDGISENKESIITKINASQNIESEQFAFTVPENFLETNITIETTIKLQNVPEYIEEFSTIIPVIQLHKINMENNTNQTNGSGIHIFKNEKTEKQGIWENILSMIRDVFN